MIYNLATLFFVGQMGDPEKSQRSRRAAGIHHAERDCESLRVGGSSVISRFLGSEQSDRARQTSTFCIFSTVAVTAIFSVLVFVFQKPFLLLLGANDETYEFASSYLIWVLVIGGVPTVLGMLFGHLVRSEGSAKQASIGMSFGGILNIILDPIFIMTFGMENEARPIATMSRTAPPSAIFLSISTAEEEKPSSPLSPGNSTRNCTSRAEWRLSGSPRRSRRFCPSRPTQC